MNINTFTFKIIKKNRKEFIDDEMVQKLLDNSHYLGFKDGYIAIPFEGKFLIDDDADIIKEGKKYLKKLNKP